MRVDELHLLAIADCYLRGQWLGGRGSERTLSRLPEGRGTIPVTRITGSTFLVKTRRAAEFARSLGELAVRLSGGARQVSQQATQAQAQGVPLWIARRYAPGPVGPIAVAVDRRTMRVDVWGPSAPTARLRAPRGLSDGRHAARGLELTVGEEPMSLTVKRTRRRTRGSVVAQGHRGRWELLQVNTGSSRLLMDGERVAVIQRPDHQPVVQDAVLLPLADVRYESSDPLNAVLAHLFAVSFGLGSATGTVRFTRQRQPNDFDQERSWDLPWFSDLGSDSRDTSSGHGGGDGWGADGSSSGGGGGSDGGWGGGDGGGGGGGGDGGGGGGGGGGG